MMLRFLTSGESHGECLTAIIEGIPSGLSLCHEDINKDLALRQISYGRGKRMEIEKDTAEIKSGVRHGRTLGSPICLVIQNADWQNWHNTMSVEPVDEKRFSEVTKPRPGHADLAGALKYDHRDMRNILERSSARETAARVAVGAVCRRFLHHFGIEVFSYVTEIGHIRADRKDRTPLQLCRDARGSELRMFCAEAEKKARNHIDSAKKNGDSVGGVFEVVVKGAPPGIGSHIQWDSRFDARLAMAFMSIQAIKGVEIGIGFDSARNPGSKVHDEIYYSKSKGFYRKTNNAGGIEGGMTTGEEIIIRAAMKPIATLYSPLHSVDVNTKKGCMAAVERSDICRVPSAAVIGEAMACIEALSGFIEMFGGSAIQDTENNLRSYLKRVKEF